ncbi:hypothetical protein DYBT9275_04218 [Dyadobacter sp. CECT 9275]|uniref:Lipoprotein n=1 Tax=Dyadobacter helix TaxID=2822344 RepID=A0A916JGA9_9BACT|nr:hypothetical protein [Dyadobacter sp. CECT 9275]CAG5008208.1 hypothetical protein DYBT9275_04218 [Dyadobacter sp. CECT 9275]
MGKNRIITGIAGVLVAAIALSSCVHSTYYRDADYGYRYGHGHRYYVAPPPPRVVVVRPSPPPRRVIHADRYRSSRHDDRHFRKNNNRQYGRSERTRGPR